MRIKFLLKNVIKIAVSVVLFIFLFQKVSVDDLKKAAGIVGKRELVTSAFVYVTSVIVSAMKWKILLADIPALRLVKTCFKAQFYSMVLPGQLFGEASKIVDLKESSESQGKIASSVIIDKITSLIGMMMIGITGVMFTNTKVPNSLRILFMTMMLFLLALIAISRLSFVEKIIIGSSYCFWKCTKYQIKKFSTKIYRVYVVWKAYVGSERTLFQSMLLGAGNQVLGVIQVWLISDSMSMHIDFIEYCWIMPAVSVILLLPISFGGLGVREISLSGFLALFGVASEKAIVISLILLMSQIAAAGIGMIVIGHDLIKQFREKGV